MTILYNERLFALALCDYHYKDYLDTMADWTGEARYKGQLLTGDTTTAKRLHPARGRMPRPGADLSTIRSWARAKGYQVSHKGKVPNNVQAAYLMEVGR